MSLLAILLWAFSALLPVYAKSVDGVVAVVDKNPILLSELNEITRMALAKEGREAPEEALFLEMRRSVLNRIIDDRVMLARAKAESTAVSDDEVNEMLDEQVKALAGRYGSPEILDRELAANYGLTLAKLKKQYRKDISDNLVKQRFREKLFRNTTVTREEVTDFFIANKDSLPKERASVHLSHILRYIPSDADREAKARKKITEAQMRIQKGEPFEKAVAALSEDPAAQDSGDIGFIKKGSLGLPEFEAVAFALKAGEISSIVRTKIGFHLIKAVARTDREVHVRHLVVLLTPSEASAQIAVRLLDSLSAPLRDSASFALAARQYSEDENTKDKGGSLGWYTMDRLLPEYAEAVKNLPAGGISKPVQVGDGYHLFRVNAVNESRDLTLEDDYAAVERMAQADKAQKLLEEKLNGWRGDFYIRNYLSEFEEKAAQSAGNETLKLRKTK